MSASKFFNTALLKHTIFCVCCLMLIFISTNQAQGKTEENKSEKEKISFRHPEDSAFDMSSFLLEHQGVMPVFTIITEPAVDYGAGLALLYFHKRKAQYKTYVPPDISGVIGLGTLNGTWGAGAFHMHTFGENRVRTVTAILKPDIHYDYYGNNSTVLSKNPVPITLDSWIIYQKAQMRIAETKFYVGASYLYFNADITIDTIPRKTFVNELIKKINVNSVISTITPMVSYDSRNNIFTPTKGVNAEVMLNYSAQWLGSSDDYTTLNANFYTYYPVSTKLFSAYRFEACHLMGDAPFYAYPSVVLRGIPAMRYQSSNTMVAETEWRYNVYKRWSLLAFTGGGKAFESTDTFNDIDWAYTLGTGFRYEIARALGIHMGTDFAWGNAEDFAFYIVFGSSW